MGFSLRTVVVASTVLQTAMASILPMDAARGLSERAVYDCSDPTQQSIVTTAYTDAKQLAAAASSYITANGADSLYQSYFGAALVPQITWIYDQIANESRTNYTLVCEASCASSTIAITTRTTTTCIKNGVGHACAWKANTVFCPLFYDEAALSDVCSENASGSQASTVVHEMSHALGHTKDYPPYGCANARALALSNATEAVNNAENYGCFSTEVYKAANC
ncbi:Metalloprotease [Mycena sanguinolenta]|uniref:Metalloprotease n=1 Tax=Mycena sanguinolenta TaxID=230812 RepID=A0A8H7DM28_9AGAR|nr:Metalloprotease [Mycena sanguinolenta]